MRRALVAVTAAVAAGAALYVWRRARTAPVAFTGDPAPVSCPPTVINIPTEEVLFRRIFPDG